MKKLIFAVVSLSLLTGCYTSVEVSDTLDSVFIEETSSIEYIKDQDMYVNDEIKLVIADINALRDKYKDQIDDIDFNSLYIDKYGGDIRTIKNIVFDNNTIYNDRYFDDLIEILDTSIASGLKDYISEISNKHLSSEGFSVKKIGRTVVFTENRGGGDNYISIKINLLDIKDEFYSESFNSISEDNYVLDNVINGQELNLVSFVNPNNSQELNNYFNLLKIRYNMFFKDKDNRKTNIMLVGNNGSDLDYHDIGVFINLINTMDLKESEKNLLVEEYKNVFKEKSKLKNIDLGNYKLYIHYSKGNYYEEVDNRLVFFSLERK